MTLSKKKAKIPQCKNLVISAKLSVSERYVYFTFLSLSLSIVSPDKIKLKSLYGNYGLSHSELSARWYWALFDARTSGLACTEKKAALSSFVVHLHRSRNGRKLLYGEAVSKNTHDCSSNRTHISYTREIHFFPFFFLLFLLCMGISRSLQSQSRRKKLRTKITNSGKKINNNKVLRSSISIAHPINNYNSGRVNNFYRDKYVYAHVHIRARARKHTYTHTKYVDICIIH